MEEPSLMEDGGHPRAPAIMGDRALLRRAALAALAVFLVVRILLLLFGLLAVSLLPPAEPAGVPGWEASPVAESVGPLQVWERWDALWFLRIATEGYEAGDGSAAFFPLYPLLVGGLIWIVRDPLLAATLVANLAAYASLFLLYLLTTRELGEEAARRCIVYLAAFPTAFFLFAPYSESVFLALVLGAFLAARQGVWWAAGSLGALAAATRSLGLLLVVVLAVEALHQAREHHDRRSFWRSAPWSLLPLGGTGAYLLYWWMRRGDPLVPFLAQDQWAREATFPLVTLWHGTEEAFRWIGQATGGYHLLDWLVAVPALAAGVWVALRCRPAYAVYVWGSLLVALTFVWDGRPFMSLPRFVLVLFPIYWTGAAWAGRVRGVHEGIIAVSAILLGVAALLFVNWYYVF